MRKITLLLCLISFLSVSAWASEVDNVEEKGQVLTDHRMAADQFSNSGKTFTALWKNDFESNTTDWTIKGQWSIGQPIKSKSLQSGNVAATNMDGTYTDAADFWIISPQVNVGPNLELRLRFRESYKTESYYDYGWVLVSQDNGQTWTQADARCGYSDWRETSINLSHYANSQLRIAFNFQSDASFASSGWLIDDVVLEYATRDPLTATMTNLNSQDFPMVFSNVEVEYNGEGISTLTNANFSVHENGVLQTDLFDVFPPTQGGASRSTDIVFVMDNSGSMSQEQAAVRANVNSFVTSLANAGADVALGLCRYGASQSNGYPIIEDNGNLTTNVDYFKNTVWLRNVITGGTERGFDALYVSATSFSFRPGSQRVFIIITDEDSDGGNYNYNQALSILQNNSVTLYGMLDTNNSTIIQHYGTIAQATNGAYYNIYSSFADILNDISTEVTSSYLVKYRSSDPILNGVLRNVTVSVSYDGNQATASGSYVPGAAPQIVRTPATINLHDQSWAAGTQFTIAAQITDAMAPFVQSARVYFRTTGPGPFQSVQMTQGAGNVWSATTPGSAAQSPGLDYYIMAADGQTSSTDPSASFEPTENPHQIAILPNVAPVINHTPLTILNEINQPVAVNANVIDTTNNVVSVVLHYRKTGTISFSEATMSNSGGNSYSGTIPASFATSDGIDYYIRATDDVNMSTYHPLTGFHHIQAQETTILVKDDTTNNAPIANREFEISWINNANINDRYYLGTRSSDENGMIIIPDYWFSSGDWIGIGVLVDTEDVAKPDHDDVDDVMYTITLDNAQIGNDGNISYTAFTPGTQQIVIMKHTTVAFNMTVSVEWDASQAYLDNLGNGFRLLSNYLYDVYDGQLRLNHIVIYNDKENWDSADINIYANNQQWPQASAEPLGDEIPAGGIRLNSDHEISMPRIFYMNNSDAQRIFTESLYPYNWSRETIPNLPGYFSNLTNRRYPPMRTLAHEFGHYGLGFRDEYEAPGIPNNITFLPGYYFGLMDQQLFDDPQNSELSSMFNYQDPTHQGTEHWLGRGNRSCWDYFEDTFEGTHGAHNIYCPIIKPDERFTAANIVIGPNNNLTHDNLTFNVGDELIMDVDIVNSYDDSVDNLHVVAQNQSSSPIASADVLLFRNSPLKYIIQGRTADNGGIYVLGGETGDTVTATDLDQNYIGTYTVGSTPMVFTFNQVSGSYVSVTYMLPTNNGTQVTLTMEFGTDISQTPWLEIWGNMESLLNSPLSEISNGRYSISFNSSLLADTPMLLVRFADSKDVEFRIYISYSVIPIEDGAQRVFSKDGNLEIWFGEIDSANMDSALITTLNLPPKREGLGAEAEQAGDSYSLYTSPSSSAFMQSSVMIQYSNSDITILPESSIKVHRWNDAIPAWVPLPSMIDTELNKVSTPLTQPGIYAAFTTEDEPQVPVELGSFSATISGQNNVMLTWVSQSETQMLGYNVYRNITEDQSSSVLITPQIIPATNTNTTQAYSITDEEVESDQTYYYWLEAVNYLNSSYFGPVSVSLNGNTPPVMPEFTELKSAYPNPFNGLTNIEVAIKAGDTGAVTIYNIHGQSVRTYDVSQGWHKLIWDGKDQNNQSCGSGVYFYKLSTQSFNETKKMIKVK